MDSQSPTDPGLGRTLHPVDQDETVRSEPPRTSRPPDFADLPVVDPECYAVGEQIARGGMGRIFRARDRRLGRPVAIKELLGPGRLIAARFEREARVTARLQHPAIVPIYEAGRWPTGEPFFAMKMIRGRSLRTVIRETPDPRARLGLLSHIVNVADALAYAHSEGIVHRDLKPENILVGPFGETVIIDWGLAKDLRSEEPDSDEELDAAPYSAESISQTGAVLGTPATMPPEQAAGEPVDERADVYALGAVLYHLLAGRRPFRGTAQEVLEMVQAEPPPRLESIAPDVPPDLIAIVDKAMSRDPNQRYPSARELAAELKRFQSGQLVDAHSYTAWQLLKRWLSRFRAAVAVGATALVVVVAVAVYGFVRTVNARERAVARADELTVAQARSWLDRDPTRTITLLADLSPNSSQWSRARVIAADAQSRGMARVFEGHTGRVTSVDVSPDGRHTVSASADHTVRVWDLASGESRKLTGHGDYVTDVRFIGNQVAASASHDHTVRIWHLDDPSRDQVLRGHRDAVLTLDVSPDGLRLASGSRDQRVGLFDLETGRVDFFEGHAGAINDVTFSPDGDELASAGEDGTVRIWDLATGSSRVFRGHRDGVLRVAFSPDGTRIASGSEDHGVRIWDRLTGKGFSLESHQGRVVDVLFTRDGEEVISGSEDGTIRFGNVETRERRVLTGHGRGISRLVLSPDGRTLASASSDSTVRLWDVATGLSRVFRGPELWIYDVAFSPDGRSLVSVGGDRMVRVYTVRRGSDRTLEGHEGWVTQLAFWEGGQTLISVGDDRAVRLWTVPEGQNRAVRKLDGTITALSADGRSILASSFDGTLRLYRFRMDTTHDSQPLRDHSSQVLTASFSANGDRLAAVSTDGSVRVWDAETLESEELPLQLQTAMSATFLADGDTLAVSSAADIVTYDLRSAHQQVLRGGGHLVSRLVPHPHSRVLAAVGTDPAIRIWDVETGTARALTGHESSVKHVAFSPDGASLASASADRSVRVWDLKTGEGRVLDGHTDMVWFVAFSPDGRSLASGSSDHSVRLWDLATGEGRALLGHDERVWYLAFSPDGSYLASASKDHTVRLWSDNLPHSPNQLRRVLTSAVR